MTDVAVAVEGVGKRYRIGGPREPYTRLTESLANAVRRPFRRAGAQPFWALRDVTFDVPEGEVLGIVGRNGAGKSTLLKILSRITDPTEGTIVLRGRVGSLLEVGTGFHPELTGRENIFLSGSVLGMRRADIRRRFDEIVAFAEVDRFLDTPVKRYSSGMQVRLGFAVAAHLEPEILVVDEVLAVGDAAFQRKCLAKMEDVAHNGRTVLFVSHNMAAVESLCTAALLLREGRVHSVGSARAVVQEYLNLVRDLQSVPLPARLDREGSGPLRIVGISTDMRTGSDSQLSLDYRSTAPLDRVTVSVGVFSLKGDGVALLSNELSGQELASLPREGRLICELPSSAILPGRYTINVHVLVNGVLSDWVVDAAAIDVHEGDFYGTGRLPPEGYGSAVVAHRWVAASAAGDGTPQDWSTSG